MQRIVESVENHRKLVERFGKWLAVGATGTVVDYGIYISLTRFVGLEGMIAQSLTRFVGLEEEIAQGISFTCAVINNYILNRTWTFGDIKHKRPQVQFFQFFIVSALGLGTRTAIFYVLFRLLGICDLLAMSIGIIVVLIWNFFANLVWTFREAE